MPYDVVQNEVKEIKASAEIAGEPLVLGSVRERLQPIVDKAGALSSDFAPAVVSAKYRLATTVPLKPVLVQTYTAYLAANKVDKPDIWAARDIALPASGKYAPVNIAIWDSGVDTALFADRVVKEGGKPAVIAFDRFEKPGEHRADGDSRRAARPAAADEVDAEGLLRPAVEHRHARGERGQEVPVDVAAGEVQDRRSRRSTLPATTSTARTSPASRSPAIPTRGLPLRASSSTGT